MSAFRPELSPRRSSGKKLHWGSFAMVSVSAHLSLCSPLRRAAAEDGLLANLPEMLGVDEAKELDARGYESRPACLMAGTHSGTAVTMKVLVEEEVVAPMG